MEERDKFILLIVIGLLIFACIVSFEIRHLQKEITDLTNDFILQQQMDDPAETA